MDYAIRETGAIITVIMLGPFTYNDQQSFGELLQLVRKGNARKMDLDFTSVTFMDSSALGMLLMLKDTAERQHTVLRLRSPQESVKNILKLSRLDTLFEIVP